MMEREKVFFDTNRIRGGEDHDSFFGNKSELKKFEAVSDILIPDICIKEIKAQKIRKLKEQKSNFISNPIHRILGLKKEETENLDIEGHIDFLEIFEDLKYEIVELMNKDIIDKVVDLAINKSAPFEDGDRTDKGFKDSYIYFIILDYLQRFSKKQIFLCTGDGRLKDSFKDYPNVICVENFEEFKKYSISSFVTDYFIENLNNILGEKSITKDSITDSWTGLSGNRILKILLDNEEILIEIDLESKEIVTQEEDILFEDNVYHYKYEDFQKAIYSLINSGMFLSTHNAISRLGRYINFLSDDDVLKILEASVDNSQIYMIVDDIDVKQFILDLYKKKKDILNSDLKLEIERLLGM